MSACQLFWGETVAEVEFQCFSVRWLAWGAADLRLSDGASAPLHSASVWESRSCRIPVLHINALQSSQVNEEQGGLTPGMWQNLTPTIKASTLRAGIKLRGFYFERTPTDLALSPRCWDPGAGGGWETWMVSEVQSITFQRWAPGFSSTHAGSRAQCRPLSFPTHSAPGTGTSRGKVTIISSLQI